MGTQFMFTVWRETLVGEKFGESQAKLQLAGKTLVNLSPASIAISYATNNWRVKLWQIRSKSPKFFPAKASLYSNPRK